MKVMPHEGTLFIRSSCDEYSSADHTSRILSGLKACIRDENVCAMKSSLELRNLRDESPLEFRNIRD